MSQTSTSSPRASSEPDNLIPLYDSDPGLIGDKGLDDKEIKSLNKKPDGKEIVDWVRGEYQKCKGAHAGMRSQWYMNLSFYKGDQYVQQISGQVVRTRAPQRRVRLIINRVRPMIRAQLSQMTSQHPTAEVVPASAETEDVLAAEAAQAVFENCKDNYDLDDVYLQAAFWQATCGIGYVKTYWDSEGGDGLGCHSYSAPTPFHVMVPDLTIEDIEKQPYVLNLYTKPVEWVKLNYGQYLSKDYKPTVVSTSEIMDTQYLNFKNSDRRAEPDSSLFIEAWIKPGVNKNFPKGGMVLIVDDTIVEACFDGLPYNHGQYPFTKFDGIPSGGYYHTSAIEDFIQLQMELNRNRSQRSEARNLTSKPQWISPRGVIDVAKWRNEPGQVLEYTPGLGKPEPMPISNLPAYVVQEEEMILRDMEDVSGQHQISRGQNPSGVTSGTAISFLQETDNSFMATVFLSIERGFKKIAKQTIQLAIQYWDIPRIVKITGGDTFSVKELMGADIKSGTDVRVESGSSLPVSRAARIALFMDLMKTGLVPATDGLRLMNIPNMREFYNRIDIDKRQAQRENQKMMEIGGDVIQMTMMMRQQQMQQTLMENGIDPANAGMSPLGGQILAEFQKPLIPVNQWDNHQAHIEEHTYFMKGQTFDTLDEPTKQQFEAHVQAHKDEMAKEQMTQMMGQGQSMGQVASEDMSGQNGAGNNQDGTNQFSGLPPANGSQEPGVDSQPPA